MERLTDRCWRNFDPWECCGQDYYCQRGCHDEGGCANGCIVPKLYARLARYEDTGMEPDEIRSLLQTGADGLYKKLPCKEGDPVWWIDVDWTPWDNKLFYKIASGKFRYAMLDWQNPIYTSQAAAEAALAKMEKGET